MKRLSAVVALTLGVVPVPPSPAGVEVPIELAGHIFVHTTVNGLPARLVLDPIEGIMLDRDFVRRSGLRHLTWRDVGAQAPTVVGGAGSQEHEVTWAPDLTLRMDTLQLPVPRAPVIPLDSMMQGAFDLPPDGLLGSGLLAAWAMEVQVQRKVLVLREPGAVQAAAWPVRLPMRVLRNRPVVEGTVRLPDGTAHTMLFLVDLGMSGGIRLTTHAVDSLALLERMRVVGEGGETGLGGSLESTRAVLPEVRLGGLVLRDYEVSLARETSGADAHPPWQGLIGLELLAAQDFVHDVPGGQLLLGARR